LPAPLVWVVYAHVPFRKFYPALRISARFLKRHSAPGFASLTISSMSCRSDHQRKRSAQNGSREYLFQHDDFPLYLAPIHAIRIIALRASRAYPPPSCSGPLRALAPDLPLMILSDGESRKKTISAPLTNRRPPPSEKVERACRGCADRVWLLENQTGLATSPRACVRPDCVADDAVSCEPVSASLPPVLRCYLHFFRDEDLCLGPLGGCTLKLRA